MKSPDLLVLDGENRTALGLVRSMARRGLSIAVGSNSRHARSSFSRHVEYHFNYDFDGTNLQAAHAIIIEHVKTLRPKVLMPVMNPGWRVINAFYDEYSHFTRVVPNPGKALFDTLTDKRCLAEIASRHDIPIPTTFRPATVEEALTISSDLPYPVLLKARNEVGGVGILKCHDNHELAVALETYSEVPIIQEFIDGEDLELTILCIHGQALAGSAYLSLRNYPLPCGPPVACRTIKDETLMNLGKSLLKKLDYHGVAHLDFRRDIRDGKARLLDFNARLAGTNEVSLISGVDFGYMLYKLASNEGVDPVFEYEIDKEFRWILPGELNHLARSPQKWKTLRSLMRWRNVSTEISLTDPLPHLAVIFEHFITPAFKKQNSSLAAAPN